MLCNSCGKELAEDAKFCGDCGTVVAMAVDVTEEIPVTNPAPAGAPVATEAPAPAPAAAPIQDPTATYANSQVNNAAAPQAAAEKGILASAWNDITTSAGWIKRLILLMAMKCVPVLSFFADGYILDWAAQAARGNRAPLPKENFTNKIFLKGVFMFVIGLLGVPALLILLPIEMIPVLGSIIVLIISLFTSPFIALMNIRMAMSGKLSSAFDLSEIWRRYKSKLGSLVGAAFFPAFIISLIFFAILLIVVGFIALVGGAASAGSGFGRSALYGYGMGYGAYGDPNIINSIIGIIAALGVVAFVAILLYVFVIALAEIWTQRAIGIWISRYAPEWAKELKEEVKQ